MQNTLVRKDPSGETPLGRLIREQGRIKGWVAEQIGCDRSRLSRLISGESNLTLEEAVKASRVFGCEPEDLLPETDGGEG